MHSIAAGPIVEFGGITITNTMLAGIITTVIIILFSIVIRLSLSIRPNSIQAFFEIIYDYIYDLTVQISDKHRAKNFFPFVMGFFVFILISNYTGLLPFYGDSIIYSEQNHTTEVSHEEEQEKPSTTEETELETHESEDKEMETEDYVAEITGEDGEHHGYPLLRGATTDMNYTFALSLVSFALVIIFGIIYQKPPILGFLLHYFQPGEINKMKGGMKFGMIPLFAFVGFLEIMLEPLKSISLSFRLFGNVFAGETLIAAMSTIANGDPTLFVVIPFFILEFLVAFIQAFVFALLTLVFISLATSHH